MASIVNAVGQNKYWNNTAIFITWDDCGLGTLGFTDARADDLADCFDYNQTPIAFQPIMTSLTASDFNRMPASCVPSDDDF